MVPRTQTSLLTALPVDVYAVVVDVVGCPLHLDLKAVWFAKHAGWSGYTTGMANETSIRHGRWRCALLSQHVGSFIFFFCFFSCTFSITIITSSMIMMSGHFWFMVVLMTGWAVNSLLIIFPMKKVLAGVCKRLLYVAWMDHKIRYRHRVFLLFQLILHGWLWVAVFYVWCVKRLMHDGEHFQGAVFWEWDCREKCGVISDASEKLTV